MGAHLSFALKTADCFCTRRLEHVKCWFLGQLSVAGILLTTSYVELNNFDRSLFVELLRSLLMSDPIKFYMNCVLFRYSVGERIAH